MLCSMVLGTVVALMLWAAPVGLQAQLAHPESTPQPQEAPPMLVIPRTMEFVPLPTTDAEALRVLDYGETLLTETMRGLYLTYRAQGHGVLDALAKTLAEMQRAFSPEKETTLPR